MIKKFPVLLTESQLDTLQGALGAFVEDCIGDSGTPAEKRAIDLIAANIGAAKGQALAYRKAKGR